MDHLASSSVRNRGQRPDIVIHSAEVELSDIAPPASPGAKSVGNDNTPDGYAELRRQLSPQTRNGDYTETDQNEVSSNYDTVSDVTVVTRSLRTWDVAALIINKMVRFRTKQTFLRQCMKGLIVGIDRLERVFLQRQV